MNKIVDVHCHVIGHPDMFSPELQELFAKVFAWNFPTPTPEALLEQMDLAGVDYAVLQAYDMKEVGINIPNEFVAQTIKEHPDRFICGYASTNPIRRGVDEAVAKLEEAYALGLRGLKLHPLGMQLSPNDKSLYPLYEKCIDYGFPVGYHIQPIPGMPQARLIFSDIVPLDELAHDLPDLKIQICHFGKYPWPPDVIDLVCCLKNNRNVYTDTSAPMPMTKEGIKNTLHWIKEFDLTDKAMFGTDFPVQPQSWWVECVEEAGFTEEQKADLMGRNALRFIGREDLLD
ncbi:MAG: amidohydrolase [Deltaproteobacteria bacterium]|nr:amidohydrolase [Deltaproteobacteria bacterium]